MLDVLISSVRLFLLFMQNVYSEKLNDGNYVIFDLIILLYVTESVFTLLSPIGSLFLIFAPFLLILPFVIGYFLYKGKSWAKSIVILTFLGLIPLHAMNFYPYSLVNFLFILMTIINLFSTYYLLFKVKFSPVLVK